MALVAGIIVGLAVGVLCVLWGALVFRSTRIALALAIMATFLQGSLQLAADFPSFAVRLFSELTVLLLVVKAIHYRVRSMSRPRLIGVAPVAAFCIVAGTSLVYNGIGGASGLFNLAMLFRHVVLYYLLVLALVNLPVSRETVRTLTGGLSVLFLLQLPAAAEKFLRRGMQEGGGIGTIHVQAGALSTVVPLFAMSFLFALYLWRRRFRYLALIPCFTLFGLLGEKRAVAFLVPAVLGFVLLVFLACDLLEPSRHSRRTPGNARPLGWRPALASVVLVSLLGIYAAGRLLDSLSPDGPGGRFDVAHMAATIVDYETGVSVPGVGRIATTRQALALLHRRGPGVLLLGLGPGSLVESSLTTQQPVERLNQLGVSRSLTGITWIGLQVGVAGAVCLLWLYAVIFVRVLAVYRAEHAATGRALCLGLLGAVFVFVLDYLAYSQLTLLAGAIPISFYSIAGLCLRDPSPALPTSANHESSGS